MIITKKIVLLGHFGVGKTSLIRQFIDKEFNPEYMVTIGLQVKKKEIEVAGKTLSFIIWDIEGNISVEKARTSYLLGSSAFIYVVDLTRPETFENLNQELKILHKQFPNTPVVTVGNKTDLTDINMLQAFLNKRQIKLDICTSAKTGEQVDNLFYNLAKSLLNNEQ